MPRITVLVAVRNAEKFIRGCIDCLLAQTIVKDLEIIAIDNNSEQNEKKIVAEYQKKYPFIKYIFAEKISMYHAWNTGINHSKGKYITNLNSDDRLKNDALEIMAKTLDDNPDVALVYGDTYITSIPNETFDNNSSHGHCLNWPDYSHKELLVQCICGPHPMWRRQLHKELGYFDENYKITGDYEFWLRIAEKHKMLHIPQTIGLYYKNPDGVSTSSPEATREEISMVRRKYFISK